MPELPEVETIVRSLRDRVIGRTIDEVRVTRTDIVDPPGFDLARALLHQKIVNLSRRGKKIIFELESGQRFYIHLGMTGRLTLHRPDSAIQPHTHLVLSLDEEELRFVDPRRFGGVFWLGTTGNPEAGLGPEPLEITPRELGKRLAKTRRAIKTALLDQKLIAGLGNIYVDEALFASRIDPRKIAGRLSDEQVTELARAIKTVLKRAIEHRGSTLRDYRDASGQPGNFQKVHQVYDRENQPCLVCGTTIRRIVLGGRSTHFCPNCIKTKGAKHNIRRTARRRK